MSHKYTFLFFEYVFKKIVFRLAELIYLDQFLNKFGCAIPTRYKLTTIDKYTDILNRGMSVNNSTYFGTWEDCISFGFPVLSPDGIKPKFVFFSSVFINKVFSALHFSFQKQPVFISPKEVNMTMLMAASYYHATTTPINQLSAKYKGLDDIWVYRSLIKDFLIVKKYFLWELVHGGLIPPISISNYIKQIDGEISTRSPDLKMGSVA